MYIYIYMYTYRYTSVSISYADESVYKSTCTCIYFRAIVRRHMCIPVGSKGMPCFAIESRLGMEEHVSLLMLRSSLSKSQQKFFMARRVLQGLQEKGRSDERVSASEVSTRHLANTAWALAVLAHRDEPAVAAASIGCQSQAGSFSCLKLSSACSRSHQCCAPIR